MKTPMVKVEPRVCGPIEGAPLGQLVADVVGVMQTIGVAMTISVN